MPLPFHHAPASTWCSLPRSRIGSVSETYTAPPELCARTLDDRARHYRREAGYYYSIGRWVNDG